MPELLKGGFVVSLVAYIWHENRSQVVKLETNLNSKADKVSTDDMESRLIRSIEKIEARQTRDVEGLRTEMGGLRSEISELGVRMESRFDKLFEILAAKK